VYPARHEALAWRRADDGAIHEHVDGKVVD
jgi:hypothetical protein